MTTNRQYLKTLKRIHARASWGRHRGLLTTDEVDEEEQALLYAIRAIEREDEYMSEPTMITPKGEAMTQIDLGLNIDMLDADRLRLWADRIETYGERITEWGSPAHVVEKMCCMARGIEAEVRDVGELRKLALSPRPNGSAWQPIETAPKDGTVIDVWLGDANEDEVQFYCTPGTRRSAAWSWKGDKFRPFGGLTWMQTTFVQPTHWQPLPSPPTEAGQ